MKNPMRKKKDSGTIVVTIDPSTVQQVAAAAGKTAGQIQNSLRSMAALGTAVMPPGAAMGTVAWNYPAPSEELRDEFREAVDHAITRRKLKHAEEYLVNQGIDLDEFYRDI